MSAKVRPALTRYRIMAFVTGSFLLLLTVVTAVKYIGLAVGWEHEGFTSFATLVGIVHGWIFMIYVAACAELFVRMKWPLSRLITLVLGGVVPVLSFVMERRVTREVAASLVA